MKKIVSKIGVATVIILMAISILQVISVKGGVQAAEQRERLVVTHAKSKDDINNSIGNFINREKEYAKIQFVEYKYNLYFSGTFDLKDVPSSDIKSFGDKSCLFGRAKHGEFNGAVQLNEGYVMKTKQKNGRYRVTGTLKGSTVSNYIDEEPGDIYAYVVCCYGQKAHEEMLIITNY